MISKIRCVKVPGNKVKAAFLHKGEALIYFAISKVPHESVNFLKR